MVAGKGLGISTRWIVLQDLARMGVTINTATTAQAIVHGGVLVSQADGQQDILPADTVVMAVGAKSENRLYEELKTVFPAVYSAGDASCPRTALEAIREGFDVGSTI
jgi:2,4-dienoyl-CoA reductase (NADPH2)